jgi:hypothetical protein
MIDELITLDSNNGSEDNVNLDTERAPRFLESRRLGSDVLDLDSLQPLPTRTANEHDDSDISVDNTKPPRITKRQRSTSPRCDSILRRTSASPLTYNEDGKDSPENSNHSDSDESGEGGSWSKRRKVSAPPVCRTALNNRHKRSQRSPSSISEEDEDDGTLRSFASTTSSTPASESGPPTETKLCPEVVNAD